MGGFLFEMDSEKVGLPRRRTKVTILKGDEVASEMSINRVFNHSRIIKLLKSLCSLCFTSTGRHPQRESFENFSEAFEDVEDSFLTVDETWAHQFEPDSQPQSLSRNILHFL